MTNQEINERIAAITGFHNTVGLRKCGFWYRPNGCGYTACECEAGRYTLEEAKKHEYKLGDEPVEIKRFKTPNYAESLDACSSFEDLIENSSDQEIRDYIINLEDASNARGSGWGWRSFRLARATPLKRCEAFLRLKGQWDEN